MKRAVLKSDLVDKAEADFVKVEKDKIPKAIAGSVVVRPLYSRIGNNVAAWAKGKYILPAVALKQLSPMVPGTECVGVIENLGPDVYGLKVGQIVYTTSFLKSIYNDDQVPGDESLLGFLPSPNAKQLLQFYKNGCWSERVRLPCSNVYLLPDKAISGDSDLMKFMKVGGYAIALGALERGGVKFGDTLLVNGGSGNLGSMVVQLGLILGCKKIYSVGRNKEKLKRVKKESFENDSRIICLCHDELKDVKDVNVGIDFIGNVDKEEPIQLCIQTIRNGGSYVCCGGSKIQKIPISYVSLLIRNLRICGSFMYEKDVPMKVIRLMESGVLKCEVGKCNVIAFENDKLNKAIQDAANNRNESYLLKVSELKEKK